MKHTYHISGMNCQSCVGKIKQSMAALPQVNDVHVQLEAPQLVFDSPSSVNAHIIQALLDPKFTVESETVEQVLPEKSITTYKPLLLIVSFIAGTTLLAQYPFDGFDPMLWMRHFMAGFFIVFAFFKLLNVKGFATSYAMYDIVAARWNAWGYIYPYVELVLGILYLTNIAPFVTNIATIIILGISTIGVIQSNLQKKQIKCACLGDVFNLPMSVVTIVEDVSMVLMAVVMLLVR